MRLAPVELGVTQVEIAERATRRDVRQRVTSRRDTTRVAELARQFGDAFADLAALAIDPFVALQVRRTAPFDDDRRRCIADAVGQRFPFLDGDALPCGLRNEARYRAHQVDVLDDDARIVEMRAVVEDAGRAACRAGCMRAPGCPDPRALPL